MSKMVEVVAKAMYRADASFSDAEGMGFRASWDADSPRHAYYLNMARAAIEAMRRPDTKMLRAACAAMSPGKRPTQRRVSERAKHGIRYRAMIDAALQGAETGK